MEVWWLAIDQKEGNATYQELKERGAIAQGWPELGDLQADGRLAQLRSTPEHQQAALLLNWLQLAYPGSKKEELPSVLVSFFAKSKLETLL